MRRTPRRRRSKPAALLGAAVLAIAGLFAPIWVPSTALAMAAHAVRAAPHTAYSPVLSRVREAAPPVGLTHPAFSFRLARREAARPATHRSAASRLAAKLKR